MLTECLSAVLIILLLIAINGYVRKNHDIPGPFPLPVIGGAYVFIGHHSSERILAKFMDLINKYSQTFSILLGNIELIGISKPEHVHVFCTSAHLLDHSELYNNMNVSADKGLFTANGALWKAQRRAWTTSFHPSVIRTFVKTFQNLADVFVEKLKQEVNGPEFPLYPYTRDYSIEALLLTQFEFDYKKHYETRNLNELVDLLIEIIHNRVVYETVFKLPASGKMFTNGMNCVRKCLNYMVEKKRMDFANDGVHTDNDIRKNLFLRQLLGVRKASKELIITEIVTLIMGGTDTVANTIGFTALMLGKHQDVQERVFLEDQEIQRHQNGQELEMNDLDKYEYLTRVIKETMRLFPGGPIIARTAAENVQMCDITIPRGSSVACFIFALHRDTKIYPNPLAFDPDNFLPERIAGRHPYSYVPFSGGPRNCIGTKHAMALMKVFISTIVRNYRLFSNKNVEDIKLSSKIILSDAQHYLLRIEERSN